MAIPNQIRGVDLLSGIPGEIAFDGPQRAITALLDSATESNNVFGRAFTYKDESVESVQAGGTGFFAGILIAPKAYMLDVGYASNLSQGEFLVQGEVYVALDAASADFTIGAPIWFQNATGAIGCGTLPANGATAIPGGYVSRHNVSASGDGTPRLAVVYIPGLANLPENEVEVPAG